eukprot:g8471.t1
MRMKLSRRANIMSGRADKEEQKKSKKRRETLKAKVNAVNAFSNSLAKLKSTKGTGDKDKAEPNEDVKPQEEVGGFTTKNMGGLAALLKSKESTKNRKDSMDSFDSESDWDSD